MTAKVLLLANQKGGVGKSMFDTQFSYYLVSLGYRVLKIDMDHQANSTKAVKTSGKAVVSQVTATQLLRTKVTEIEEGNFVLVPADKDLTNIEREGRTVHNTYAANFIGFINAVKEQFDVILIDTNPNPDIRVIVSMIAATHVLSPIELNQEAIDGIHSLLNHPEVGLLKIQKALNPKLVFLGILPNKVDRSPFHRDNLKQLVASGYAKYLIKHDDDKGYALIPLRSVLAEAQADGKAMWEVRVKDDEGKPTSAVKTAGRDAWRELKPHFALIAKRMDLEVK